MLFRRFVLLMVLAFASVTLAGAVSDVNWSIDRMSVKGQGDSLKVRIDWSFAGRLDDGAAFVVKAALKGAFGELLLPPVSVYGRKAFYGKDVASGEKNEDHVLFQGGRVTLSTEKSYFYESWMDTLRLSVAAYDWTKKRGLFTRSISQKGVYMRPPAPEKPEYAFELRRPARSRESARSVRLESLVEFEAGSTKFDIDYGDNEENIRDLIYRVSGIASLKSYAIRSSQLTVYLPPESSGAGAQKRSLSCCQSLFTFMQRAGAFKVTSPRRVGGGANWDGLREWTAGTGFVSDPRIMEVLSWEDRPDEKWDILSREKPLYWDTVTERAFPELGKVVYEATFTPPDYLSGVQLESVFNSTPEALSPHDFYSLTRQYSPFSDDWIAVILTGARVNPSSEMLNIAAAMVCVKTGDVRGAVPFLRHIGSSDEARYTYASWLMESGRYGEAMDIYDILGRKGYCSREFVYLMETYARWNANDQEWMLAPHRITF